MNWAGDDVYSTPRHTAEWDLHVVTMCWAFPFAAHSFSETKVNKPVLFCSPQGWREATCLLRRPARRDAYASYEDKLHLHNAVLQREL